MTQDQQSDNSTSGIERAKKNKWGYDPRQVDEFLEQAHARYEAKGLNLTQSDIQNVSFDLAKGGYVISQVDAALERLERAVVDKQTSYEIAGSGRVAWKAQTEDLFHRLASHAERAEGQRFAPGRAKSPSYDRKQVDRLIDGVILRARVDLDELPKGKELTADQSKGLDDITSTSVANTVFTQRKGKRGYDERQVDYYLNSCVELLSRLESYERIADYVNSDAADRAAIVQSAQGTGSLFENAAPAVVASAAAASTTASAPSTEQQESFDDLHKAEQQIYATSLNTNDTGTNVYETASLVPETTTTSDTPTQAAAPVTTTSAQTAQPVPSPFTAPVESTSDSYTTAASASAFNSASADEIPPSFPPSITPEPTHGTHGAHASSTPELIDDEAITGEWDAILEERETALSQHARHAERHANTDDHPQQYQSESLDALASMVRRTGAQAQSAQASEPDDHGIQTPSVPSLGNVTIPDLPVTHRTDATVGETTSNISFRSLNEANQTNVNVEIPDLSFPSFDDDASEGKHAK